MPKRLSILSRVKEPELLVSLLFILYVVYIGFKKVGEKLGIDRKTLFAEVEYAYAPLALAWTLLLFSKRVDLIVEGK